MFENYPDILTVPQVCEALSVSKNTIYKVLSDGTIPHIRVGSKYLVPKPCLIEFIEKSLSCNGGHS